MKNITETIDSRQPGGNLGAPNQPSAWQHGEQKQRFQERWRRLVLCPRIVRRSLKTALIVGSVFAFINYSEMILSGLMEGKHWLRMILSYCVPYCVSTFASVSEALNFECNH